MREGRSHPDPIVETASLAAVVPPDPTYQHSLKVTATTRPVNLEPFPLGLRLMVVGSP